MGDRRTSRAARRPLAASPAPTRARKHRGTLDILCASKKQRLSHAAPITSLGPLSAAEALIDTVCARRNAWFSSRAARGARTFDRDEMDPLATSVPARVAAGKATPSPRASMRGPYRKSILRVESTTGEVMGDASPLAKGGAVGAAGAVDRRPSPGGLLREGAA